MRVSTRRLVSIALGAVVFLMPSTALSHHVEDTPDGRLNAVELVGEFAEQKGAIIMTLNLFYASASGGEAIVEANAVEVAFTASIEHMEKLKVRACLVPVKRAFLREFTSAAEWFRAYLREPDAVDAALAEVTQRTADSVAFSNQAVLRALC